MAQALKILVIVPNRGSSFIEEDLRLLQRYFAVRVIALDRARRLLARTAKSLLAGQADLVVLWFVIPSYAPAVAFLAKLFPF